MCAGRCQDDAADRKRHHQHIRPILHLTAPSWINDPCAPGYDPNTGLYHLFYQCNPYGCEWGNMAWGHITSKDMITWKGAPVQPVLSPSEPYDKEGVFTGCFAPSARNGHLTVFYTSIRSLPFHWSTPPYPRNAAGLSVATSNDGGRTWQKSPENPVLLGEPEGLLVTGFRDPYVAPWPELDIMRDGHALYGLVSGGLQDSGPAAFLYAIKPDLLEEWKYIELLAHLPARYQSSQEWSGNFGINWECLNFMTLKSNSTSRNFLIVGAEGDVEREHIRNYKLPPGLAPRTVRQQLWMSGELETSASGVQFVHRTDGFLDHGCYYAANSFVDPRSGRRIVYGWIPEEDISLKRARKKGWNGSLAIPRELFLLSISGVTRALRCSIHENSSIEVIEDGKGGATLLTMGIRPISEIIQTQRNCLKRRNCPRFSLPAPLIHQKHICHTLHSAWSLEATIRIDAECEAVGFYVRHNEDAMIRTKVTFLPAEETITVDREFSSERQDVNKCPEKGPFTLFETKSHAGTRVWEKLQLQIISDGDTLEVFANGRFALATMVYSEEGEARGGITAHAVGGVDCAVFESLTVSDGLNGMRSLFANAEEN